MKIWVSKTKLFLVIALLFFQVLGCENPNAKSSGDEAARDVSISEFGPLSVVVKQCRDEEKGSVKTDGILVLANNDAKIESISATVFYDHNQSGELDELDGVIVQVEDGTRSARSEFLINPGLVHSAPGIGVLMLDCKVEVTQVDKTELVKINADLSSIFDSETE